MATFFLCMIYAAFISLGLPDSLLGAAWPAMQPALGVPLDSAGVLSMIVAARWWPAFRRTGCCTASAPAV